MTDTPPPADKKPSKTTSADAEKSADTVATSGGDSKPKSAAKSATKSAGKSAAKSAAKTVAKPKTTAKKAAAKSTSAAATAAKPETKDSAPAAAKNDGKVPETKPPESKAAKSGADASAKKSNGDAAQKTATPETTAPAGDGRSSQIGTIAIAAGLGAVLAIVLQLTLGLNSGDRAARAQLAELQSQIERAALAEGDPEAVGRLQVQLDGMEEDLRALNTGVARAADVAALETSVNDARERLAVVEASSNRSSRGGRVSNGELAAIEDQMAVLSTETQTQLAQVDARFTTFEGDLINRLNRLVSTADLAALADRVVTLEDDQLAQEMYKAATALGLAQLARTAQGSGSFAVELEALSALRPRDAYIEQLRPLAQTGIATNAMLVAEFGPVARRVVSAHRNTEDQGWFARLWARITGLVSFRRTGDIEGDTVDAILARAELRVNEGNLSAAADEMASLPEGASEPAVNWLAQAQGRVALNELIAGLSTEVIGELDQ